MQRPQLSFVQPETGRAPPPQPAASLAESGSRSAPPFTLPMAFVNEIVSDADIDRYGLPFQKGAGRYWTRDKERDIYLWGGLIGNPARGEPIEGRFHLGISGSLVYLRLRPGYWSAKFSEVPYVVTWDSVESIQSDSPGLLVGNDVLLLLKEALVCYGRNGRDNKYTGEISVKFNF